jgi:hypothetical protein
MREDDLCLAVREIYRRVMKNRGTTEDALKGCEELLRRHRGDQLDTEVRRVIARMIAEEPVAQAQPSSTR